MLPNFLIVGAEKAGTTTLAAMLSEHPDVFMCDPKEPRFFTHHNWQKGTRWYESLFTDAAGFKAIGEASPVYTWAPETTDVPQKIFQVLGKINYIYIVRNPIERMISHYRHAVRYRWIPENTSFENALELVPALKDCSHYFYQIEQFLPYSQRDQWHLVTFEELLVDPERIMKEIFVFLEIDEMFTTKLQAKNVTDEKRRPPAVITYLQIAKPYLPDFAIQLGITLSQKFGKKTDRPTIPEHIHHKLVKELKPDIQRLSDFYAKDFELIWSVDY